MRISASAPVDSSEASPTDADAHTQTTPAASRTFKSVLRTTGRDPEPTCTRLVNIFRSKRVLKEYSVPQRTPESVVGTPLPARPLPRQTALAFRITTNLLHACFPST